MLRQIFVKISKMYLVLFVYIQFLTILASTSNTCNNPTRGEIESHLATKTPYRVLANKIDQEIKYKGCVPLRIWAVIRHGTRNPSRKVIRKAKENLMRIREKILGSSKSNLCPHDLAMFRNWSFNVNEEEQKFLVYEGEDEMIELAERFQNRLPRLLPSSYQPEKYKFKYTATQRTMKSAQSFAVGLFGRDKIGHIVYPQPLHKDPVLRFYKLCSRWKFEVDQNPDAQEEKKKFLRSPQFSAVVKIISEKTGVHGLTRDDIHLMYTICAFETAWNKQRISPWCSLFNHKSIRVMEFVEDLEYYWIDGYGYDLTYQQACPAFIDMIEHIRPNSIAPNATFYFTHSGTLLKLLAHLGLYKDDFVLTHADFSRPRKWMVSKIDSFATNLAFITFDCAGEPKVLVMHQEKVVRLPGCPQEDLCSLKRLEKEYKRSLDNCNFQELCRIPDS